MYLNKATLIGNLTRDPELKSLPSGQKQVSQSLPIELGKIIMVQNKKQ